VTSQNVWSRYDRHFVGIGPITWHDVWSSKAKFYGVIHIKLNQLVSENVHTITGLPISVYLSAITVTSIFQNVTHKMAAETSWHGYGTKLRHRRPM